MAVPGPVVDAGEIALWHLLAPSSLCWVTFWPLLPLGPASRLGVVLDPCPQWQQLRSAWNTGGAVPNLLLEPDGCRLGSYPLFLSVPCLAPETRDLQVQGESQYARPMEYALCPPTRVTVIVE